MARIIARQADGTALVAIGSTGVIVPPDGRIPADPSLATIVLVDSALAHPVWEMVDEPVPEGMLPAEIVAAMRAFADEQRRMDGPFMRALIRRHAEEAEKKANGA
ncbi:hypothetical protein IMZ11_20835 [Microtetraspora sp. AC03309]|uniref:hypothetical protein n=1 Tax=Microtetraspora sp. AC03309 TaxID=2779376 RepID=UPI001E63B925|nr:hypothetical protein [Microtetraspora sp. AC03309]MCC5578077.1 hypothetical protein [Microtetraspora sp. AC03309]